MMATDISGHATRSCSEIESLVIAGGNHAGYADYGPQAGDGKATISADAQQEQVAGAIVAAMRG